MRILGLARRWVRNVAEVLLDTYWIDDLSLGGFGCFRHGDLWSLSSPLVDVDVACLEISIIPYLTLFFVVCFFDSPKT